MSAPGPDKCPNELLKTMSDEEFLIVQVWVTEILTLPKKTIETTRQSQSTMNGTISQLHEGGITNKTSDQRPVVLLNSGYQLLNYIINERLKRIVEQTNVAGRGQAGSKCQHQHAKNAFCHASSPQTRKASLSSRHQLQKCLQCNVTGSSLARDEHVSYTRR